MFRQSPVFQFVPTASCPITVHHWGASPVISALPFCYSHTGMMSCLNLLFSGQDSPSSLTFPTIEILQSLPHFSGTLLVSVQHSHISPALGSPKVNTAPQCTSAGEELQLPQPAPPRSPLVAFTRAHWWLTFNLLFPWPSGPFLKDDTQAT